MGRALRRERRATPGGARSCSTVLDGLESGRAAQPSGGGHRRHPDDGHHVHRLFRRPRASTGHGRSTSSRGSSRRPSGRASPAGLEQRLVALNRFIDDVYNDQRVIADGVFPGELLDDSANFRPECKGVRPRFGVWAHISGSDLVRDADGTMYVLEDNLRVPSGRQLRAGEPGDLQAGVPGGVRPPTHRPGRLLHRGAVQDARLAGPGRRRQSERRRAHPGHLQLGVLRALVSRPADGGDSRRGQRSRRVGRRPCVHAHDRRPRARRRDLSPHRRPVPRPRGVPARFDCSAYPG